MVREITPTIYDWIMSPLEKYVIRDLRIELANRLPIGAKTLEVGAGTGANLACYPSNQEIVATDLSYEMLLNVKESNFKTQLIQTDASNLPFPDNSFDAATATLVFCSLVEPMQTLDELQRVLKPNSVILLLEHVRPNNRFGILFDVLNPVTVRFFSENLCMETESLVAESGIEIIRCESHAKSILKLIEGRVIK